MSNLENGKKPINKVIFHYFTLVTILLLCSYILCKGITSNFESIEVLVGGPVLLILVIVMAILSFLKPKLMLINLIAYIPLTCCALIIWFPEFIMNGAILAYGSLDMWLITLLWMFGLFFQIFLIIYVKRNK